MDDRSQLAGVIDPTNHSQQRGRRSISKLLTVSALTLLLSACGLDPVGDFGRPRDLSVASTVTEAFRLAGDITNHPVYGSDFRMTPDETRLREIAFRLRAQIHNLRPMRWTRYSEVAYAEHLHGTGHTYGPSRLSLINEELDADKQTLNRFAEFGRRVFTADQRRMDAVIDDSPYYTRADKRNARSRVRQNCAFVKGTFEALAQRIEAYEYAIDRARIETPEISAAVVEESLDYLRDTVVALQTELVGACQTLLRPRGSPRRAANKLYGRPSLDRPLRPAGRLRQPGQRTRQTEVYKPVVPEKAPLKVTPKPYK